MDFALRLHSVYQSAWGIFLLILVLAPKSANSGTFDSIASLRTLVLNEEWLVKKVEDYLVKEEERLENVRQQLNKIQSWSSSRTSMLQEEWETYVNGVVEHPLNALSLIKDWTDLYNLAGTLTSFTEVRTAAENRGITLPNKLDYTGALVAIIRLQKTYSIPANDLANGKVYNFTAKFGLSDIDFFELGKLTMDIDHGLAMPWFELFLEAGEPEPSKEVDAYMFIKEIYEKAMDFERAWITAHKLQQKDPNNPTLQNDMNRYKREIEVQRKIGTLANQKFYWKSHKHRGLEYYESLCRGENIKNSIFVNKDLICVYRKGVLPYVQYKEEIHNFSPRISLLLDTITDQQAEALKEKAFPGLFRAQVGDPSKSITSDERVGKLSWLWDTDPEVDKITKKVSDLTGLSTQYRDMFSDAEAFQIVNYGIGGQYEPHYDYYEPEMLEKLPPFIMGTGDRIATFMYYLSDVTAGGATVFPSLGVRVPPTKNAAVYWYNFDLAGEIGDDRTLHAGCPVLLGQKWVANKWIRQGGQTFRRRCALSKNDIDPIFYS